MSIKSAILAGAIAVVANAANVSVAVGQGGLTFTPASITAAPGDMIVFTFFSGPHSVYQSTFATPCQTVHGGFDSGEHSNGTFTLPVKDMNPVWGHCSVPGHCMAGMVFSVNAPTTGMTFDAFQANAMGASAVTSSAAYNTTATASTIAVNATIAATGTDTAHATVTSAASVTTTSAAASSTSKPSAAAFSLDTKVWMTAFIGVVGVAASALLV